MAIAPNVDTWFVYTDGLHEGQEPFLVWITNMSSNPNSPLVHSVSYGDEEKSVTFDYASRVDIEFQVFICVLLYFSCLTIFKLEIWYNGQKYSVCQWR